MSGLVLAGRSIDRAEDHLRRYCGLAWSGGAPETWAYAYFDALEDTDPNDVFPTDVLAAAALHPKLTRADLVWFVDHRHGLGTFLRATPEHDLVDADPAILDSIPVLAGGGVELSLLTKVLHRKRPGLIPMLDRRLLDWYRLYLTTRGAAAWPQLVRALALDLARNHEQLERLRQVVPLTHVRITDIAVWMEQTT
jgi:hypothetical protein